jgi:hypothetical protein
MKVGTKTKKALQRYLETQFKAVERSRWQEVSPSFVALLALVGERRVLTRYRIWAERQSEKMGS